MNRATHRARHLVLALGASALLTGIGCTAYADTPTPTQTAAGASSISDGPVTVGNVPMRVCVAASCQSTPAVSSVTLDLAATPPPPGSTATTTLARAACSTGIGVGATATGPAGATVTGALTLVLGDGTRIALPIKQVVPAAGTVTLTACTA